MINKSMQLGALVSGIMMLCASVATAETKMASVDMLVNTCVACHGNQGVSTGPAIPSLAGMTRNYLIGAMLAYKFHDDADALEQAVEEGGDDYLDVAVFPRYSTIMSRIATGYTIAEIEAMADYFSAQTFQVVRQQFDAEMAEAGRKLHKAKCEKCHENGGASAEDDVGILAGQWMPYLRYTLEDYHDGRREMPKKMRTKLQEVHEEFGPEGIENLIHYYARAE